MYTEPALEWDRKVLEEHYKAEVERKESLLAEMEQHGITKEMLMSNPQFAAVLEALGADIPLKISGKLWTI